MSLKQDLHCPVALALRKEGFIPLPRLWVKPEDMPKIHSIAHAHSVDVNRIRRMSRNNDPETANDIDAAWEAHIKTKDQD